MCTRRVYGRSPTFGLDIVRTYSYLCKLTLLEMSGLPPGIPPPPGNGSQQVVYHVYQINGNDRGIDMPMPTGNMNVAAAIKFFRGLLLFLIWAVWVLYIAGISMTQNTCNAGSPLGNPWPDFPSVQNPANCVQYFALFWWSVWLQFIVVVAWTLLYFFECLKGFSTTTMYMFLMSSVLLFFMAQSSVSTAWYQIQNLTVPYAGIFTSGSYGPYYNQNIGVLGYGYVSWSWTYGSELLAAGSVGSLIVNFIYIIWYSYVPQISSVEVEGKPEETKPEVEVEVQA
ncbi:hypothetical protein CEUSTIGMA_g4757.t1 [Chlamydomonas eustigma]|uniref:Uncharacterized protein n=1 Tax=Chlamydomonas eustigma TaxID=1157962 RepID=A0A250X2L5_9CHLO|nr:hypothetical protein CEUSTIGMA_g4757.t1 [Chlamydomonas eustigma]|eukprot:GAX77311.1 hypothetical protein CEUSTIGMA_g4757.t1 [Chlamydomonas eustigma]